MTFDLALDPGRLSPRAVFKETQTRTLTRVQDLGLKKYCEPVKLLLPVRGPQMEAGMDVDRGHLEAGSRLVRERKGHRIWHADGA